MHRLKLALDVDERSSMVPIRERGDAGSKV